MSRITDKAREEAWDEWARNVILPAGADWDVAHEAFCAGWEAQRKRVRQLAVEHRAVFLTLVEGAGVLTGDFADLIGEPS